LDDVARAVPAQHRPKLSGRRTQCVSPDIYDFIYDPALSTDAPLLIPILFEAAQNEPGAGGTDPSFAPFNSAHLHIKKIWQVTKIVTLENLEFAHAILGSWMNLTYKFVL
jgi:hypothetical protein